MSILSFFVAVLVSILPYLVGALVGWLLIGTWRLAVVFFQRIVKRL